jgi:glucose/arabinose dehydrogenase
VRGARDAVMIASAMRRGLALVLALSALAPVATARAAPVRLVPVGTFSSPVYVTAPPGDTRRIFVVQQGGTIVVVHDGVTSTFADLTARVLTGGERGLLSMAFAPDYAGSGLFYVDYTARTPTGRLTIEEHRVDPANPNRADPAYARVLATVPHDRHANHNGGQLQFGRDGLLYASTGDGGGAGDPAGNGQNLTSSTPPVVNLTNHDPHLGKILRLNPRAAAPAVQIFAYGLRNPWRFSFDRATGDLIIADVGQGAFEEVDFARAPGDGLGANYGWSLFEGLHTFPGGLPAGAATGTVLPVIEKSHADGWCAITGGYVVRDPALPELAGTYVYSDLCKGRIFGAELPGGRGVDLGLPTVASPTSFGEDGCGRVYVASLNGLVFRLASGGGCGPPGAAAPAPRPPVAAPAPDTRAPVLRLTAAARQHALRTGVVTVRATCDERCVVRARGRLTVRRVRGAAVPRALVTRRAVARLAAGAHRKLRLRLSPALRRRIRGALSQPRRRAIMRVTATATDATGNVRRATRRVRIVR